MSENNQNPRVRIVPIDMVQDADPLTGEEYYRRRDEDVLIRDAEVVSETPFSLDGLFEKTDDLQSVAYEVENPSGMPEDAPYDSNFYAEPEDVPYGDEPYAEPDDPSAYDAPAEDPFFAAPRRKRRDAQKWYRRPLLIAGIAAAVIAVALFYWITNSDYREKIAQIERNVPEFAVQLENGSPEENVTIEELVDFYTDLSGNISLQSKKLSQLNRQYWWIIGKDTASSVGLADVSVKMDALTLQINELKVFLEQVKSVKQTVLGTEKEPGHLRTVLPLDEADAILLSDEKMIDGALDMCASLEDLPETFRRGQENQKLQLTELREEVELMRAYVGELSAFAPDIAMLTTETNEFRSRSFANRFVTDLQAQYAVISRVDDLQERIGAVKEKEVYQALNCAYGLPDLVSEDVRTMIDEAGVIRNAWDLTQRVRTEDEALIAHPTDRDQVNTMLETCDQVKQDLAAIELPGAYSVGRTNYLEAMDARKEYLNAYVIYLEALGAANKKQSQIDDLNEKVEELRVVIQQLLDARDMRTAADKSNEMQQCLRDADKARTEWNTLQADAQSKKAAADALYADYTSRVNN